MKQEMEVAMKLLEKDTHEKQDTLAALRLQLDQVKTLNVQMFHKAQVQIDENDYKFVFHTYTHTHTDCVFVQIVWFLRTRTAKQKKSRQRPCSLSRG